VTVVDVRDLTVTVDDREIVAGVSFAMAAGEVTALVGESGSGKTTTALALLGAHRGRVTGHVEVSGTVGYLPQQPSAALNPVRRIGSVLTEIARRHVRPARLVRQRVLDAVRQAQVPVELLRRYPHQLSGGQQQRVVLAHVLIGRPSVLVVDEPTTGQDVLIRAQLVEELGAVARRGIAILLLTHDLQLVRALAGHVLVMHRGVVVESGSCEEVLGAPRHPHTRRLADTRPVPVAGPGGGAPVVSVRGLVAGHRRVDTLHGVSLRVRRGDRIAVVGRSGSGKTTLARCIAGLHPYRGGEILLGDALLSPLLRRRSLSQLARVQYVFQDARASFSEFAPVVDQVARTGQRLRGLDRDVARERAVHWLDRLGVPGAARLPAGLSGGELQRAALVRAVLAEPEVLICDEITSGLDPGTQAELLEVLGEVHQGALVVITHDLAVVAGVADRVVVLDEGRVVEEGSVADVLGRPVHRVTRALVAAAEFSGREDVSSHGPTGAA
jgi:peptide/nickel transport system ATP-binding protein